MQLEMMGMEATQLQEMKTQTCCGSMTQWQHKPHPSLLMWTTKNLCLPWSTHCMMTCRQTWGCKVTYLDKVSCFSCTLYSHNTDTVGLSPINFWSPIWTSHRYVILKFYNVKIDCAVTFWWILIACSLARLFFMTPTQSNLKRVRWRFHTIQYNERIHNQYEHAKSV